MSPYGSDSSLRKKDMSHHQGRAHSVTQAKSSAKTVRFGVREDIREFSPSEPSSSYSFSQGVVQKLSTRNAKNTENQHSLVIESAITPSPSNTLTREEVEERVKLLLKKLEIPFEAKPFKPPYISNSNHKLDTPKHDAIAPSDSPKMHIQKGSFSEVAQPSEYSIESQSDTKRQENPQTNSSSHVEFSPDYQALSSISNSEMLKEAFGEDWLLAKRDLTRLFNLRPKHHQSSREDISASLSRDVVTHKYEDSYSNNSRSLFPSARSKRSQPVFSNYESSRKPFIAGSVLNNLPTDVRSTQNLYLEPDREIKTSTKKNEEAYHRSTDIRNHNDRPQTANFKKRLMQYLQCIRLAEVRSIRAQEKSCMEICELNSKLIMLNEKVKNWSGKTSAPNNTLTTLETPPRWMAREAYESGDVRESIIKNTQEIAQFVDGLVEKRNTLLKQMQDLQSRLKAREEALKVAEEDLISRNVLGESGSKNNLSGSKRIKRKDLKPLSEIEKLEIIESKAKVVVGKYVANSLDDTLIGDPRVSLILQDIIQLQAIREKQATEHEHFLALAKSEAERRRKLYEEALETKLQEEQDRFDQEFAQCRYHALQTMAEDIELQAAQGAAMIHRMAQLDTVRMQSAEMTISETMVSPDVCLSALQRDLLQVIEENKRLHKKKTEQSKLVLLKKTQLKALNERLDALKRETSTVDAINEERGKIENEMKTKLEAEMRSLVWQNVVVENMIKETVNESEAIETAFNKAIDMVSMERAQLEESINAKLSGLSESI